MSPNTAEITLTGSARQELGRVRRAGEGLLVITEIGELDARVAASCLLAPEEGDVVALTVPARGPAYVVAVLERRTDLPARVRVEGAAMQLEAPDGRLSISSPDGVDLASGGDVTILAKELDVTAEDGRLRFGRLVSEARALLAKTGAADVAFDVLETAAERLTQRLGRAYRFVEDQDVTRAGTIDARAKESFLVRAKDAMVTARRLVRLDGEQIHLG